MTIASFHVYAKDALQPKFNNTMSFQIYSYYTAPGKQVVQAMDFAGLTTGTTFGAVTCNKLHLQASSNMLLFYGTAASSSGPA